MLRNIDVDLLRSFVTIAELRSFTRAAAALFRSQSTVSTQIRRLEELAGHDPSLVVGVLGGGSGTHRDTFELVAQAERFGGRLALFGRKINGAEDQTALVRWMRLVADGEVTPAGAVRGYHADLARQNLVADRDLDTDLRITEDVLKPAATAD